MVFAEWCYKPSTALLDNSEASRNNLPGESKTLATTDGKLYTGLALNSFSMAPPDWLSALAEVAGTFLDYAATILLGGCLLMACATLFPLPFVLSYVEWCFIYTTLRFLGAK
jgi:hypothetical protein